MVSVVTGGTRMRVACVRVDVGGGIRGRAVVWIVAPSIRHERPPRPGGLLHPPASRVVASTRWPVKNLLLRRGPLTTGWAEVLQHMSPYGWGFWGAGLALGLSIVGAAWGIWTTGSSMVGAAIKATRISSKNLVRCVCVGVCVWVPVAVCAPACCATQCVLAGGVYARGGEMTAAWSCCCTRASALLPHQPNGPIRPA
jgi:F0F1-type ATP synthase membrane subunit c/vacuolar-type H+-ATPase subunit K